jgi:hypothetical protein
MADSLSPQVDGDILFCACEANVSVANKAEALRRRCCLLQGPASQHQPSFGARLRGAPLSARAASLSS